MQNIDFEKIADAVRRVQSGDKSAYSEIYNAYVQPIYFLCLELLSNQQEAQDATQDIFVNALEKIGTLSDPMKFDKWLFVSATRKCRDICIKKRPYLFSEYEDSNYNLSDVNYDESLSPQENYIIEKETVSKLHEMISTLSYKLKSTVLCYYFENMSISEIALFEGVSESAIQNRLFMARKKLKEKIEKSDNKEKLNIALPLLSVVLSESAKNTFVPISLLSGTAISTAVTATASATAAATGSTVTTGAVSTVAASAVKGGMLATLGAKITAITAGVIIVATGTAGTVFLVNKANNPSEEITTQAVSEITASSQTTQATTDPITLPQVTSEQENFAYNSVGSFNFSEVAQNGFSINGKKISFPCTVRDFGDDWYIDNGSITNGISKISVVFMDNNAVSSEDALIKHIGIGEETGFSFYDLLGDGLGEKIKAMFGEPYSVLNGTHDGEPMKVYQYYNPDTADYEFIQINVVNDNVISNITFIYVPQEYR